ncbi:ArsR/SmtB family transcription factor [Actinomycetes bacterium M1A6_2h]
MTEPLDAVASMRAAEALDIPEIDVWASRFGLLSDANRLRLLLCLHHSPGVAVSDLAAALNMSVTAVSHALRLLRQSGWVTGTRDGKVVRYRLADDTIHEVLHSIGARHGHSP